MPAVTEMDGKEDPFRFKFGTPRLVVQAISLIALNSLVFSWIYPFVRIEPLPVPLPVLMSIDSPTSTAFSALDLIQVSLSRPEVPWIAVGMVLLMGAILGRSFCGWVCPIGLVQDIITTLRGHLAQVPARTHRSAIKLKYLVLAGILLISGTLALSLYLGVGAEYKLALGALATGPFIAISPDGTLFGTIPRLIIAAKEGYAQFLAEPIAPARILSALSSMPTLAWVKLFVLGGLLYGAYRVPRFWCRYFCPVGAMMSIFQRYSYMGMARDPARCARCPHCEAACPMQISILDLPWEKFNDPECVLCMACVDACPYGALKPKFS